MRCLSLGMGCGMSNFGFQIFTYFQSKSIVIARHEAIFKYQQSAKTKRLLRASQ